VALWRAGRRWAAAEFRAEFGEVAGDEGVWPGAGLDPEGDVAAAVDREFHVDLVAGEVSPRSRQRGWVGGAADGF
jgi:hypothetical protein